MKYMKRMVAILPMIVGIILLYGIFSGNMEKWIHTFTSAGDSKKVSQKTYPIGVIENYREAFEWYAGAEPQAEVYDPDNKTGKPYLYYGQSVNETEWYEKCYAEDVEYNNSHKLSEKYIGTDKYNPDKIVGIGEQFMRKYMCVEGTVNEIDIVDSLNGCEEKYYLADGRIGILPSLNTDGMLENVEIKDIAGKQTDNQNLKFIKVQLTMKSNSEWVQEVQVTPKLGFFDEEDGILVVDTQVIYTIQSGADGNVQCGYTGYPIYLDLGYYDSTLPDSKNIDEVHYPMRKGESVTYNVIYAIPEEYIDKAYLVFDDIGHQEEFTYNLTDITIIKVTE